MAETEWDRTAEAAAETAIPESEWSVRSLTLSFREAFVRGARWDRDAEPGASAEEAALATFPDGEWSSPGVSLPYRDLFVRGALWHRAEKEAQA